MIARIGVGRMIEKDYDEKISVVIKEIHSVQTERNRTKLKMHIAGRMIDSSTKLITNMAKKNFCVYSYVNNLKEWHKENAETQPAEPVCRLPFMSLSNTECLDKYFDKYADELTKGISLQALFLEDDYNVTEKDVIAFKNKLKLKLENELWDQVSDFSIYDYISENKTFEYVDSKHIDFDNLLQEMDSNSEIFVRTINHTTNSMSEDVMLKLLFRDAPDNNSAQTWNKAIDENFIKQPTAHDLSSPYKIFIIRLEGLSDNQIAILK
jgi:hypothetical protein